MKYKAGEFDPKRRLAALSTPSGSVAPKNTEPTIFCTPTWARYFSLIVTLILGVISVLMLGFAIFLLFQRWWWVGAFIAALASFMAGLTGYVLRDLRGKWGLRVELLPDRMVLDLPAGRSLIHRPVAQHLTIPYGDIDAVETRLEAYASIGMENMQRAYVLSLKQGDRIFFCSKIVRSGRLSRLRWFQRSQPRLKRAPTFHFVILAWSRAAAASCLCGEHTLRIGPRHRCRLRSNCGFGDMWHLPARSRSQSSSSL
jgi:hypothetical protein